MDWLGKIKVRIFTTQPSLHRSSNSCFSFRLQTRWRKATLCWRSGRFCRGGATPAFWSPDISSPSFTIWQNTGERSGQDYCWSFTISHPARRLRWIPSTWPSVSVPRCVPSLTTKIWSSTQTSSMISSRTSSCFATKSSTSLSRVQCTCEYQVAGLFIK